jgi:hypothetical protein
METATVPISWIWRQIYLRNVNNNTHILNMEADIFPKRHQQCPYPGYGGRYISETSALIPISRIWRQLYLRNVSNNVLICFVETPRNINSKPVALIVSVDEPVFSVIVRALPSPSYLSLLCR